MKSILRRMVRCRLIIFLFREISRQSPLISSVPPACNPPLWYRIVRLMLVWSFPEILQNRESASRGQHQLLFPPCRSDSSRSSQESHFWFWRWGKCLSTVNVSLSQSLVKNTRVNHWVFHKAHLYCRRMIRLEGSFPSPITIAFNKKKKKG